jgi:hypothetical protein
MNIQMSPKQIQFLLDELCVDLGFCLSPDAQARILGDPPADVDAFTDAVIRSDGLDPHAGIPVRLRRDVRASVMKHFKTMEDDNAA